MVLIGAGASEGFQDRSAGLFELQEKRIIGKARDREGARWLSDTRVVDNRA
jgi:hypothetical protein